MSSSLKSGTDLKHLRPSPPPFAERLGGAVWRGTWRTGLRSALPIVSEIRSVKYLIDNWFSTVQNLPVENEVP